MQIRKRGDEIKKKSSPLKLLSRSQPNFAEMILGWSSSKIVSFSTVLYTLGRRSEMLHKILEEDHPRIISAKLG
jgi:hypothetical protein